VGRQWLGRYGKTDNGVVTVTTVWADERVYYPLHARPYTPASHFAKGRNDPGFRTKLQIAADLVAQGKTAGVVCRAVVADCFYGDHDDLCAQLRQAGWGWVMALKPLRGTWQYGQAGWDTRARMSGSVRRALAVPGAAPSRVYGTAVCWTARITVPVGPVLGLARPACRWGIRSCGYDVAGYDRDGGGSGGVGWYWRVGRLGCRDDLFATLHSTQRPLRLVELGCSGETTTTMLHAAAAGTAGPAADSTRPNGSCGYTATGYGR
jgi:hypothetical protein